MKITFPIKKGRFEMEIGVGPSCTRTRVKLYFLNPQEPRQHKALLTIQKTAN